MNLGQLNYLLYYLYICIGISAACFLIEHMKDFTSDQLTQGWVEFHHKMPNHSNYGSLLFLFSTLIFVSIQFYFLSEQNEMLEPKLTVGISGHALGMYGIDKLHDNTLQTFVDYVVVAELNEYAFKFCYIDTFTLEPKSEPQFDRWANFMYKNIEGVVKGSYRAYSDEENVFIHCMGKFPGNKKMKCEYHLLVSFRGH